MSTMLTQQPLQRRSPLVGLQHTILLVTLIAALLMPDVALANTTTTAPPSTNTTALTGDDDADYVVGIVMTASAGLSFASGLLSGCSILTVDALAMSAIDTVWRASRYNSLEDHHVATTEALKNSSTNSSATLPPALSEPHQHPINIHRTIFRGVSWVAAPVPLLGDDPDEDPPYSRLLGSVLLLGVVAVVHIAATAAITHAKMLQWLDGSALCRWPELTVRTALTLSVGIATESWLLLMSTRKGGDGPSLFIGGLGLLFMVATVGLLLHVETKFFGGVFKKYLFMKAKRGDLPNYNNTDKTNNSGAIRRLLKDRDPNDPSLKARIRLHAERLEERRVTLEQKLLHQMDVDGTREQFDDLSMASNSDDDEETTAFRERAKAPPAARPFSLVELLEIIFVPSGFWDPYLVTQRTGVPVCDARATTCRSTVVLLILHAIFPTLVAATRFIPENIRLYTLAVYFAGFGMLVLALTPYRRRYHLVVVPLSCLLKGVACIPALPDIVVRVLAIILAVVVVFGAIADMAVTGLEFGHWSQREASYRLAAKRGSKADSMEDAMYYERQNALVFDRRRKEHEQIEDLLCEIKGRDAGTQTLQKSKAHQTSGGNPLFYAGGALLREPEEEAPVGSPQHNKHTPIRLNGNSNYHNTSAIVDVMAQDEKFLHELDLVDPHHRLESSAYIDALNQSPVAHTDYPSILADTTTTAKDPSRVKPLPNAPTNVVLDDNLLLASPMHDVRNLLPAPERGWQERNGWNGGRVGAMLFSDQDPGVQRRLARYLDKEHL